LVNNDVPIITPSRIYDLSDETDRLYYDLDAMLSSKELRTITRRMKVGKVERAKRGEWVQGKPPLGYKRNQDTKKLEIIQDEAKIVKYIYNLACNGYGISNITKKISNLKTRNGNAFNISSVNKILTNITYTGMITYNLKERRGNQIETISCYDAHQAIVPLELFNNAQSAIKGRFSGDR
jgi:site-specific DNA recombinase